MRLLFLVVSSITAYWSPVSHALSGKTPSTNVHMRKQKAKLISKGEGEPQNMQKGLRFTDTERRSRAAQPGFKRVDDDRFTFQHGRVVRDGAGLILCFGSCNRTLASGAQTPADVQAARVAASHLSVQSQPQAFSADSKMFLTALCLCSPQIPPSPRSRCGDRSLKPPQPKIDS